MQSIYQQSGVDEFIRKESAILIAKQRASFYGSGSGIDLVIQRQQRARGHFIQGGPVEHGDRQLRSLTKTRLNLSKMVLGDGKDNGDRLDLGDDRKGDPSGGLNDITRIDQSQTNSSSEGSGYVAIIDLDLVVLHGSLIVFDGALILKDELCLIVQYLLGNRIALPRILITDKVHSRLSKDILVPLQNALRL